MDMMKKHINELITEYNEYNYIINDLYDKIDYYVNFKYLIKNIDCDYIFSAVFWSDKEYRFRNEVFKFLEINNIDYDYYVIDSINYSDLTYFLELNILLKQYLRREYKDNEESKYNNLILNEFLERNLKQI